MKGISFRFALTARLATLLLGLLAAHPALASGRVVGWGDDSFGQATPPPSVDGTTGTAAVIAAGGLSSCGMGGCGHWGHSCAIQAGTDAVVCWGMDWFGQSQPPPSVDGNDGTATAIAAGWQHSCAIQAGTDAVVCWGVDDSGQSTPPPSVDGTTGTATAIAGRGNHTLAIRTPECSDGIDNDGDGSIDLDDPLCTDGDDDSEVGICGDGIDNDGDGFTDFVGGDSGCANPDDSSENDPTLPCDDGIDNDGDGSTDFPSDPGCARLLDNSEAPDPMHADVKLKIGLKFNKSLKDKILVKITNWQLPAGVVPTDVSVNVGGAECTGTLDAEGKFQSPDRRDSITMKQGKKTQLWNIAVKRKNNDFAASLADEGCTNADNPKPGLPVTVPLTIEVGGVAYGRDVDLVHTSKIDAKGIAK